MFCPAVTNFGPYEIASTGISYDQPPGDCTRNDLSFLMANEFIEATFLFIAPQGPSPRLFGFLSVPTTREEMEKLLRKLGTCV